VRRTLLSIAAVALAGLVLGACDASFTPDAAQVGGVGISRATLDNVMSEAASSSSFRCDLEQNLAVSGSGVSSTFSKAFADQELELLIQHQVFAEEIARLGLRETSIADELAVSEVETGLTPSSSSTCTATGATVFNSLPHGYAELLVSVQADQDIMGAHLGGTTLTSSGLAAYAAAHPAAAKLTCVSAIVVAKEATAAKIVKLVDAGASFGELAKADSTDSTSAADNGALGCLYPSDFTVPLNTIIENLPLATPSAPISFSGSWVLLEVTARQPGTALGAAGAVVNAESAASNSFADRLIARAHVTVDPQYGVWKKSSGNYTVVAASGPPDALVTNAVPLTPSAAVESSSG
jgi:hypothetical protein